MTNRRARRAAAGWLVMSALGAVAMAGCGKGVATPAERGGAPASSSYDPGAALAAEPGAKPYVRLEAYRALAEAGGGGAEDGADGVGTDPAAGGAGAPAAGDTGDAKPGTADDGAPGAPAADTAEPGTASGDPSAPDGDDEGTVVEGGTGLTLDEAAGHSVFNDARAGVSMILPTKYWGQVGTLRRKDSFSAKFKLMDKNIQASINFRPHAAIDPADAAAVATFSADFRKRMEDDARAMGGGLEVESSGTGTCGGLRSIVHAMTIRSDIAVRAASVFTAGRAYTLTVSGPKLLYAGETEALLGSICKTLEIRAK